MSDTFLRDLKEKTKMKVGGSCQDVCREKRGKKKKKPGGHKRERWEVVGRIFERARSFLTLGVCHERVQKENTKRKHIWQAMGSQDEETDL